MLLNSCQLYNRGRFSSREPGPDLVPPSPRCPTKLGPTLPTINYGPQWAANRHRKFFRLGVALRLHVRTLAATLPMRPDQCVILVTAAGTGGNTLTPSHDLVPLVMARAGARFVPKPSLRWPVFTYRYQ